MRASTTSGMTMLVSKKSPRSISVFVGPGSVPDGGTGGLTAAFLDEPTAVFLTSLRLDVDPHVVRRHHPDFHHVRVGDRDATIRPVLGGVVVRRVARIVR